MMLENKDLAGIDAEYGSIYKDKGVAYNDFIAKKNYPVLQASSELDVPMVSQVPTEFFPIEGMEHIVTQGRMGSQDLTQLSILGSQKESIGNRKIALIVSLQWFYNKDGISKDTFQGNFAPVQFYNFLGNKGISEVNKKKYAYRVNNLLTGNSQFFPEKLYAKVYCSDNPIYKLAGFIFKPYFLARKNIVQLNDKGLLYKKLKTLPPKKEQDVKKVNWDEEYKKAEEDGKSKVTNNDYMVYDEYYTRLRMVWIKKRIV